MPSTPLPVSPPLPHHPSGKLEEGCVFGGGQRERGIQVAWVHSGRLRPGLRPLSSSAFLTSTSVLGQLRSIAAAEGLGALFKGVGPNVLGVAPSKAVYFYAYSSAKRFLNARIPPDTPVVHMASAGFAAFLTASAVNPIWLVKTRLQLDRRKDPATIPAMIRAIWRQEGLVGFYKVTLTAPFPISSSPYLVVLQGVTASYVGISETMVQFVIYEYLKGEFVTYSLAQGTVPDEVRHPRLSTPPSLISVWFSLLWTCR